MRSPVPAVSQLDRLSTWEEVLSATSNTPERWADLFRNDGNAVRLRTEVGSLLEINEFDLAFLLGFNQPTDDPVS